MDEICISMWILAIELNEPQYIRAPQQVIFAYEIVLPCIFMGLSQHGDLVSDILVTPPRPQSTDNTEQQCRLQRRAEPPACRLRLFMHTQRKVVNGINQATACVPISPLDGPQTVAIIANFLLATTIINKITILLPLWTFRGHQMNLEDFIDQRKLKRRVQCQILERLSLAYVFLFNPP